MLADTLSFTYNLLGALDNTAAESINYHNKYVAALDKVMRCFTE